MDWKSHWATHKSLCKSPIEERLFYAMCQFVHGACDGKIRVVPQHEIGKLTVDIVVIGKDHCGQDVRIAVECDGHDFHEKTKEQASHDKAKDRLVQAGGYRVCRFTGSDIYKDAAHCAIIVRGIIGCGEDVFWHQTRSRRVALDQRRHYEHSRGMRHRDIVAEKKPSNVISLPRAADYVSAQEAGRMLNCCPATVSRLVKDGPLVGHKGIGRKWMVLASSVDAYIKAMAGKTA